MFPYFYTYAKRITIAGLQEIFLNTGFPASRFLKTLVLLNAVCVFEVP